jgi:hypothetical protein
LYILKLTTALRAVAKIIFDSEEGTMLGMKPDTFLAIASPFLGVRGYTYLPLPRFVERLIAFMIADTGRDLFLTDEDPLLYTMSTDEEYLRPLRAFTSRKLYAALSNDFMVPLEVFWLVIRGL